MNLWEEILYINQMIMENVKSSERHDLYWGTDLKAKGLGSYVIINQELDFLKKKSSMTYVNNGGQRHGSLG